MDMLQSLLVVFLSSFFILLTSLVEPASSGCFLPSQKKDHHRSNKSSCTWFSGVPCKSRVSLKLPRPSCIGYRASPDRSVSIRANLVHCFFWCVHADHPLPLGHPCCCRRRCWRLSRDGSQFPRLNCLSDLVPGFVQAVKVPENQPLPMRASTGLWRHGKTSPNPVVVCGSAWV